MGVEASESAKDLKRAIGVMYGYTDIFKTLLDLLGDGGINTEDMSVEQITALERNLSDVQPNDVFVANIDDAGKLVVLDSFALRDDLNRIMKEEEVDYNKRFAASRRLSAVEALRDEYLIRGVELEPESRDYDIVACSDWKVYKRYKKTER